MKNTWWEWSQRGTIQNFFWILWKLKLNGKGINMSEGELRKFYVV